MNKFKQRTWNVVSLFFLILLGQYDLFRILFEYMREWQKGFKSLLPL